MQEIQIRPHTKALSIHLSGEKILLPPKVRAKIDQFWQERRRDNPHLFNGEVFAITNLQETPEATVITLTETDYAHFLYNYAVGDLGKYAIRVIHSAALVITADNKIIFGSMGLHTSRPGVIQCCGGGIDHDDISDRVVDIEHNTAKELGEELGIDPYDPAQVVEFAPLYLKLGGPKDIMTAVFTVRMRTSSEEFLQNYDEFTKKLRENHEEPEFGELFCIDIDRKTIENFIAKYHDRLDEYMPPLLMEITKVSLLQ